jgi:hypothetical protein
MVYNTIIGFLDFVFARIERWDRGFESHSRHGCLYVRLFCVCVVLCVGGGLATG